MTDHDHNWVDGKCTNCGADFNEQVEAAGAAIVAAVNLPPVELEDGQVVVEPT